ncbi:flavodoxin [Eubacterium uniforme]|uniref:Flavodoxin n=1 Tax=Eubacterium uniforme TaxID=39495 RepID=A0A1T4VVU0_9FIRM|nr:flavodoxin [Eubacterium uniforme]SKA69103.1 flavodoxin, short chain [Eubacterium uniforme]HAH18217.1 flavodoxin [Eubacterium sp.]
MDKIYVVYWSQTGNTESMANAIAAGIKEAGKEAAVVTPSEISADDLNNASVYALGSPAMGAEVIEEEEMEPLVSAIEANVSGKKIALFGSYGWGDGEWMRSWVERMTAAGATVIGGEDAICQDAPDGDMEAKLAALGKELAS